MTFWSIILVSVVEGCVGVAFVVVLVVEVVVVVTGTTVVPKWTLSSLAGLSTLSLRFALSSKLKGASFEDAFFSEYFIVETYSTGAFSVGGGTREGK